MNIRSYLLHARKTTLGPVKTVIKRLLAARGLVVTRVPRALIDRPASQLKNSLDYVVAHRMARRPDFFFVQIGAFDGQAGDPIYDFVTSYGWQGMLVEPQKRYFSKLMSTYAGHPDLIFRNVAIGERRESKVLYKIKEGVPGLPAWAPQAASFDLATVLSHRALIPGLDGLIETEDVECITLDELFSEIPGQHVDLLQIDVEGYDHEIIRLLDLARFAPSIIRFEHKHLRPEDYEASVRRLVEHGYKVTEEGPDVLAYRS